MNKDEISAREITKFVTEVRALLQHLETDLVNELTSDLEANISLSVADGEQIPDAHDYVNELLSAAGLEVPSVRKGSRYLLLVKRITQQLRGLAPMWWLLRAFIATLVLTAVTSRPASMGSRFPMFRIFGNTWAGVTLFVLLVIGSVYLGRRGIPKRTKATEIIGAIAMVGGVIVGYVIADNDFNNSNDFLKNYANYCPESSGTGQAIQLPDMSDIPNVVGLSMAIAETTIREWSNGTIQLMYQQDDSVHSPNYENSVAVRQGNVQVHDTLCEADVVLPVWFEPIDDGSMSSVPDAGSELAETVPPPGGTVSPLPQTTMPPEDGAYVIQEGDSPTSIAKEFGITERELLEYNGWKTSAQFPYPGTEIRIPSTSEE